MRLTILENPDLVGEFAAQHVVSKIKKFKPTAIKIFVLGLPSGATSIPFYRELVKCYKNQEVSFCHVATFNNVSFVGLSPEAPQSVHTFMWKNFFKHVDINPVNAHILNGNRSNLDEECRNFEEKIMSMGPVHLFISDISPDGFVGFNEPGSSLSSQTRVKCLGFKSRFYIKSLFNEDIDMVPQFALTTGIGTMMASEEVMFIVTGSAKSFALQRAIEGGVSHMCSLSMFQQHPKTIVVCDDDATLDLTMKTVDYFKERSLFYGLRKSI